MKGTYIIQANEAYVIKGIDDTMFAHEVLPGITVDDYVLNMVKRGWKRWNGDGRIHCEAKELKVWEFLKVMELDKGDVIYFNPFIKIAESDFDNTLPEGLPNRIKAAVIDPESPDSENPIILEPERPKTWREWQIGNIIPELIEGYWYVNANYGNVNGVTLTGTELMIVYNSNDATLVDEKPVIEIIE